MEEAKSGGSSHGHKPIKGRPNARSGKIDAIKKSQEDSEAYVNKNLVDK